MLLGGNGNFVFLKKLFLALQRLFEVEDSRVGDIAFAQEAIIQQFEHALELAWFTLLRKMECNRIKFALSSPKYVFNRAYEKGDYQQYSLLGKYGQ